MGIAPVWCIELRSDKYIGLFLFWVGEKEADIIVYIEKCRPNSLSHILYSLSLSLCTLYLWYGCLIIWISLVYQLVKGYDWWENAGKAITLIYTNIAVMLQAKYDRVAKFSEIDRMIYEIRHFSHCKSMKPPHKTVRSERSKGVITSQWVLC